MIKDSTASDARPTGEENVMCFEIGVESWEEVEGEVEVGLEVEVRDLWEKYEERRKVGKMVE